MAIQVGQKLPDVTLKTMTADGIKDVSIRELFAEQPLARQRRYAPSRFSFNMDGGRCEECEGAGAVLVEMVFMADVFVTCDACGGTRFKPEILDVRIQGKSIHDVLQWTVDEAITRFHHQPKLGAALWQLQQVGLGYLRLGQPATTLSGGEAQRLKIARELVAAMTSGGVPRKDVSAFTVRQLMAFQDEELSRQLVTAWGVLKPASQERGELIAKYKALLPDWYVFRYASSGSTRWGMSAQMCPCFWRAWP